MKLWHNWTKSRIGWPAQRQRLSAAFWKRNPHFLSSLTIFPIPCPHQIVFSSRHPSTHLADTGNLIWKPRNCCPATSTWSTGRDSRHRCPFKKRAMNSYQIGWAFLSRPRKNRLIWIRTWFVAWHGMRCDRETWSQLQVSRDHRHLLPLSDTLRCFLGFKAPSMLQFLNEFFSLLSAGVG